jgi:hypothetical protein
MADAYETLNLLLNGLQLLTALMRSVVLCVKSNQVHLERKRRRNVVTNRFGLIDSSKAICGLFQTTGLEAMALSDD